VSDPYWWAMRNGYPALKNWLESRHLTVRIEGRNSRTVLWLISSVLIKKNSGDWGTWPNNGKEVMY